MSGDKDFLEDQTVKGNLVGIMIYFNDRIDASAKAEDEHYQELNNKIDALVLMIEKSVLPMRGAFLKDAQGELDLAGHHEDHRERRVAMHDRRELVQEGKKKIVGGIVAGGGVALLYAVGDWIKAWLAKGH